MDVYSLHLDAYRNLHLLSLRPMFAIIFTHHASSIILPYFLNRSSISIIRELFIMKRGHSTQILLVKRALLRDRYKTFYQKGYHAIDNPIWILLSSSIKVLQSSSIGFYYHGHCSMPIRIIIFQTCSNLYSKEVISLAIPTVRML